MFDVSVRRYMRFLAATVDLDCPFRSPRSESLQSERPCRRLPRRSTATLRSEAAHPVSRRQAGVQKQYQPKPDSEPESARPTP
eukprot:1285085-Rhodomonas_salina.1